MPTFFPGTFNYRNRGYRFREFPFTKMDYVSRDFKARIITILNHFFKDATVPVPLPNQKKDSNNNVAIS